MSLLLAIDTAANLCAVSLHDAGDGAELARSVRDVGKGHAEVLVDCVEQTLAAAGGEGRPVRLADVGSVAVSVGPGSFTGIRVGVSFARGLALALGARAVGVTTLEALAFEARERFGAVPVMVVTEAGRDGVYAAIYDTFGKIIHPPAVTRLDDIAALLPTVEALAGSAARSVADAGKAHGRLRIGPQAATADIAVYAKIALARGAESRKPAPLYLRAPDARPQSHLTLPRKTEG